MSKYASIHHLVQPPSCPHRARGITALLVTPLETYSSRTGIPSSKYALCCVSRAITLWLLSSSETQGQTVGARESLNRRKNMAQKKSKERALFSRPLRLSLAPTICPWVSEDGLLCVYKLWNTGICTGGNDCLCNVLRIWRHLLKETASFFFHVMGFSDRFAPAWLLWDASKQI